MTKDDKVKEGKLDSVSGGKIIYNPTRDMINEYYELAAQLKKRGFNDNDILKSLILRRSKLDSEEKISAINVVIQDYDKH
ncbi:MAG: hypothetical protein LBR79_03795 [Oscillospiraceae bacterium]|jgi:hypothetical protein|nr:hypothetical protein [Oscillospiraceae bacterium]